MKTATFRRASEKSRVYFMWLWLRIGEKLMDPDAVDQEACSFNINEANHLRTTVGVQFRECSSEERVEECQRILRRMWAWTKGFGHE